MVWRRLSQGFTLDAGAVLCPCLALGGETASRFGGPREQFTGADRLMVRRGAAIRPIGGQRPGGRRPGRLRRRLAGAGRRARTMTARPPRHRTPLAPARFAARWRELAACRGTDLEVFFPGRGESAGAARQVCAGCPVHQPCLDYAISNRISHGIWGGLTGRERRALQSRWVRTSRRDRDLAVRAAEAAGYTAAAIGRSFGLSRTSVMRVVARDEDRRRS